MGCRQRLPGADLARMMPATPACLCLLPTAPWAVTSCPPRTEGSPTKVRDCLGPSLGTTLAVGCDRWGQQLPRPDGAGWETQGHGLSSPVIASCVINSRPPSPPAAPGGNETYSFSQECGHRQVAQPLSGVSSSVEWRSLCLPFRATKAT